MAEQYRNDLLAQRLAEELARRRGSPTTGEAMPVASIEKIGEPAPQTLPLPAPQTTPQLAEEDYRRSVLEAFQPTVPEPESDLAGRAAAVQALESLYDTTPPVSSLALADEEGRLGPPEQSPFFAPSDEQILKAAVRFQQGRLSAGKYNKMVASTGRYPLPQEGKSYASALRKKPTRPDTLIDGQAPSYIPPPRKTKSRAKAKP